MPGRLALLASVFITVIAPATAEAARSVVPDFDVSVAAERTSIYGKHAVWVKSIVVKGERLRLLDVRVKCSRGPRCVHRTGRGRYRRIVGKNAISFKNVNWILRAGASVTIAANRRGRIGRFRTLGLEGSESTKLVVKSSGCLKKLFRVIKCPRNTVVVAPGTTVADVAVRMWEFTAGKRGTGRDDLFGVVRDDAGTKATAIHVFGAAAAFSQFTLQQGTALHPTFNPDWSFCAGDRNADGFDDLYAVSRLDSATQTTAVHVLSGATAYTAFIDHSATPIGSTAGTTDEFLCGDYNGDGIDDLYQVVRHDVGSGKTAVHIYDGASGFKLAIAHAPTALGPTDNALEWSFATGDLNRDGKDDLIAVARFDRSTNTTSVHVMNAQSAFQTFIIQTATPLHPTDNDNWSFTAGDFNADGVDDLYAVSRYDVGTAKTAAHVIDGAGNFSFFAVHGATPIDTSH